MEDDNDVLGDIEPRPTEEEMTVADPIIPSKDTDLNLSMFRRMPVNAKESGEVVPRAESESMLSEQLLGLYDDHIDTSAQKKKQRGQKKRKGAAAGITAHRQTTVQSSETFMTGATLFGFGPSAAKRARPAPGSLSDEATTGGIPPGRPFADDLEAEIEVPPDKFMPCESERPLQEGEEPDFCYDCEYGRPEEEDVDETDDFMTEGLEATKMGVSKMAFLATPGGTQRETLHQARMRVYRKNKKNWPIPRLVEHMYQDYENNIRRTLVNHKTISGKPDPCPAMKKQTQYDHIMGLGGHRRSKQARQEAQLQLFVNVLGKLRSKAVFKEDPLEPGSTVVDVVNTKVAILVSKHICEIERMIEGGKKVSNSTGGRGTGSGTRG